MGFWKSVGKGVLGALEDKANDLARDAKHDELREKYSDMEVSFRYMKENFFGDDDNRSSNYDYDDEDDEYDY